MAKLGFFEIAGKVYPLSFSLMAEKKLAERYGTLSKIGDFISGDDAKSFEELAYILALLIQQGCAYKNMFEGDVPPYENAPIEEGKYIHISEEQIMVGVNASMQGDMIKAIQEAMGIGQKNDIETIEKNQETQGETTELYGLTSGEEYLESQ